MATGGWRMLRPGSGSGAVLTLDFTLAKVRAQAGFADLAPRLPEGYAVWGTDEAAWPTGPGVPRAQLDDWLHRDGQTDRPVRAVFGFCASASLAMALAHRFAAGGHERPAVVLFDPVQVGAGALRDLAGESVRRLSAMSVAGPGPAGGNPRGEGRAGMDAPGADPPGEDAVGDAPDEDLGELATALARRYAERAAAVGIAQSIPASIVDQLSRRVETNLRFLTLCAAAWSSGRVGPDLLVLSHGHQVPASLSGAAEVRLPVTSNELLSDPQTARAAAGVLAGAFADGRP